MDIAGHEVRLNTAWVNYNCGVRMVGRLRLEHKPKDSAEWLLEVPYSLKPEVHAALNGGAHVALIKEFIKSITDKTLVPALHGDADHKNPIFESDGGKYVPTVLLVADNLMTTTGHCYSRWAALVRELQSHKEEYGVEVIKGPLFNNAVYGNSPWISRIWSLVLPCFKDKLFPTGLPWDKDTLSHSGYSRDTLSVEDWSDIEKLLRQTPPESAVAEQVKLVA